MNSYAVDLIKKFEGLRLKSYFCPAGICTIGWGHTGSDVKPNMTITLAEAEQLLKKDLDKVELGIGALIKVALKPTQMGAVIDFTYNVGIGAFEKSTLLRKLNEKDNLAASDEFLKWDKAHGVVLDGLTRRRQAERELFLKP